MVRTSVLKPAGKIVLEPTSHCSIAEIETPRRTLTARGLADGAVVEVGRDTFCNRCGLRLGTWREPDSAISSPVSEPELT